MGNAVFPARGRAGASGTLPPHPAKHSFPGISAFWNGWNDRFASSRSLLLRRRGFFSSVPSSSLGPHLRAKLHFARRACLRAERAPIPTRRGGGGEQWGVEGGRADTPALRSTTSLPSACRSWSFGTRGNLHEPTGRVSGVIHGEDEKIDVGRWVLVSSDILPMFSAFSGMRDGVRYFQD